MFSLVLAISLVYVIVMLALSIGAYKIKETKATMPSSPTQKFSILIPFRNEESHLPALLASLEALNFPKHNFEILLIDDASEDGSVATIEAFKKTSPLNISIIKVTEKSTAPKKQALQKGILQSKFNWIITTDADCVVSRNWLQSMSTFINQEAPDMVIAPVFLKEDKSSALETIETLSLQVITMGSFGLRMPLLNNGANLAFRKELFVAVEGYAQNTHIASGDDLFLMEKFLNEAYQVRYLKSRDATVLTNPQNGLQAFISQRVRWASKTSASGNSWLKVLGVVVFLMNASVVAELILAIFQLVSSNVFIWVFSLKFMADISLMKEAVQFFKVKRLLGKLLLLSLVYPFLHVYIGFRSLIGGYRWKGRYFKR